MSVRRLADQQPASFAFTPENAAWADKQIAKYPEGRQASAVLSLLWRAQKQNHYWLPKPAMEEVGRQLGMPYIRVLEVATFYTMFNLSPVGRFFIQLCGTTPCMLAGSDSIKALLERRVGPQNTVTADGNFSWLEVECLGACCNAPMVQINDDYYEDLTAENFDKLLDDLAADRPVHIGSQIGRRTSEPVGGLTALATFYGEDGRAADGESGNHEAHPSSLPPIVGAGDERTMQDLSPDRPALDRRALRQDNSIGTPDYAKDMGPNEMTNGGRTQPAMSDGSAHEKAAQAKAGNGETHGPSDRPGNGNGGR